ncbi:hypothetical protein FLT15_10670 [Paenibacillus thiaminolyticus]|uniref:hypothetical protein n=1 Tax=Paenibacillus thiaminolyticus TaxID=49283 RepID=UPI0013F66628|nr:hypothetical protein [Paenibacillus thiaminolyticus]NGP58810.1 hypothetical protein [Paenibacillus thiaminolyticus]
MKKRSIAVCMLALLSVLAMSGCAGNTGSQKENPATADGIVRKRNRIPARTEKLTNSLSKNRGARDAGQETLNGDDVSGWIAAHEGSSCMSISRRSSRRK